MISSNAVATLPSTRAQGTGTAVIVLLCHHRFPQGPWAPASVWLRAEVGPVAYIGGACHTGNGRMAVTRKLELSCSFWCLPCLCLYRLRFHQFHQYPPRVSTKDRQ